MMQARIKSIFFSLLLTSTVNVIISLFIYFVLCLITCSVTIIVVVKENLCNINYCSFFEENNPMEMEMERMKMDIDLSAMTINNN